MKPQCYITKCSDDHTLEVILRGSPERFLCTQEGETITSIRLFGKIVCPDPRKVCAAKKFYGANKQKKPLEAETGSARLFQGALIVLVAAAVVVGVWRKRTLGEFAAKKQPSEMPLTAL